MCPHLSAGECTPTGGPAPGGHARPKAAASRQVRQAEQPAAAGPWPKVRSPSLLSPQVILLFVFSASLVHCPPQGTLPM